MIPSGKIIVCISASGCENGPLSCNSLIVCARFFSVEHLVLGVLTCFRLYFDSRPTELKEQMEIASATREEVHCVKSTS